jgi:hypothetical protein
MVEIYLSFTFSYPFILCSCLLGLLFGIWNYISVMRINFLKKDVDMDSETPLIQMENLDKMKEISESVQKVYK